MIILIFVLSVAVDTSVYGQTIVRDGATTSTPTPFWSSSKPQAGVASRATVASYNKTTTIRTVSTDRNTAANTAVSAKTRTTRLLNLVQSTTRSTRKLKSTEVTQTATKVLPNRTMSMLFRGPDTTTRRLTRRQQSTESSVTTTRLRTTSSTISSTPTTAKSSTTKMVNPTTTKSSTPQPYTTSMRNIIGRQTTDTNSNTTPRKTTRRRHTTNPSRRTTKIPTTNIADPTASLKLSSAPLGPTGTSTNGRNSTGFSRVSTTEVVETTTTPVSTTPLDPTRMIPDTYVWNHRNRHIYPNPRTEPARCRRTGPSWVCDPSGLFTTEQVDELDDILTSTSLQSECPCNEHCHHRTYGFVVTLAIHYRYDPHPNQTAPFTRHLRNAELSAGTCGEDTVVSYDFSRKMLNISTGLVAFQTLTDQLSDTLMAPYLADLTSLDAERNFIGIKGFLTIVKTVFIGTYNPPEMTNLERLFIAIGGTVGFLVVCSLFFCLILGTRAFWGRGKKKNPSSFDFEDEEDKYYDPKVEGTYIPFYHFIPEGIVGNKKRMGILEMNSKMKQTKRTRVISTEEDDPEVYDDFDRFAKVGRAARMWKRRARNARKTPPQPPPPPVGKFQRSLTT